MGEITFVRHSFSCGNATRANWLVRDPKLTDGGVDQIAKQCAKLRERYRKEEGWDVDALRKNPWFDPAKPWIIFSSELLRSMETAIGLRECLRRQKGGQKGGGQKVVNRVLVAPFLAERGHGQDNRPESIAAQRKRLGDSADLVNFSLIEGDNKWLARQRPDLRKFVKWLQMMRFGSMRWNDFNVLVVTHSVLMDDTFGVMLNNLGAVRARIGPNPGQLNPNPVVVEMGVDPKDFGEDTSRCRKTLKSILKQSSSSSSSSLTTSSSSSASSRNRNNNMLFLDSPPSTEEDEEENDASPPTTPSSSSSASYTPTSSSPPSSPSSPLSLKQLWSRVSNRK